MPLALWIVETVVVLMSFFLFYHLTLGKKGAMMVFDRVSHSAYGSLSLKQ